MILRVRNTRSPDLVEELVARIAETQLRELALVASLGAEGLGVEALLALADIRAERQIYARLLTALA